MTLFLCSVRGAQSCLEVSGEPRCCRRTWPGGAGQATSGRRLALSPPHPKRSLGLRSPSRARGFRGTQTLGCRELCPFKRSLFSPSTGAPAHPTRPSEQRGSRLERGLASPGPLPAEPRWLQAALPSSPCRLPRAPGSRGQRRSQNLGQTRPMPSSALPQLQLQLQMYVHFIFQLATKTKARAQSLEKKGAQARVKVSAPGRPSKAKSLGTSARFYV